MAEIGNFICKNSVFYFKTTMEKDYIGYLPFTIVSYFFGECRLVGNFDDRSIRMKYLLGIGKKF